MRAFWAGCVFLCLWSSGHGGVRPFPATGLEERDWPEGFWEKAPEEAAMDYVKDAFGDLPGAWKRGERAGALERVKEGWVLCGGPGILASTDVLAVWFGENPKAIRLAFSMPLEWGGRIAVLRAGVLFWRGDSGRGDEETGGSAEGTLGNRKEAGVREAGFPG